MIPGTITVLSDTRYLHGKEFDYQETEQRHFLKRSKELARILSLHKRL